jgi:hypothetical protein
MNKANWYLKHVIINDLSTQNKYVFICEQWLAVEKEDGSIERIIPAAGEKEKADLRFLMKRETKEKLSDSHLWFSVLARPVPSPFGRLDRLTCIFVLLCISMLANIMYYGTASNTLNPNALNIGPFTITPEQVGVGIMTNLIVFPPSFIIMQIFRRSRDRQQDQLDKALKKPNQSNIREMFDCFEFLNLFILVHRGLKRFSTFPWWMKILAYMFSFFCAFISIFFILMYGISFGNEKVQKWITSLLISVLTSIFLTQPIQVALTAIFFVSVLKKSTDLFQDKMKDKNSSMSNNRTEKDEDVNDETLDRVLPKAIGNSATLDYIRRERLRERKLRELAKRVFLHSMFLWILYVTAYSNRDLNSYRYQNALKTLMTDSFYDVKTTTNRLFV